MEKIQNALFLKGYLVGEVDGIWGRRTIAALKAFQENEHLAADGIFGPKTARKLFPLNGNMPEGPLLPWIAEAEHLVGTKEVPGGGSNPGIIAMANQLNIAYAGDDIPWCGLFVAHCIGATLPEEVLPRGPLGARNWARFGDATEPRSGAIMVFWRKSKDSGLGHVAFYQGEDDEDYWILGGNQDDKVCLTNYPKKQFLGARWPRTAPQPGGGQPIVAVERTQDGMIISRPLATHLPSQLLM